MAKGSVFRWGTLGASLLLWMSLAVVWSPVAKAGSVNCSYASATDVLTVNLVGGVNNVHIILDVADHEIRFVNGCSTQDLTTDPVSQILVNGDPDLEDVVAFEEGAPTAWSWTAVFPIAIDLGDAADDAVDTVKLVGTAVADTIRAGTFATYTDVDVVQMDGLADNDKLYGSSLSDKIEGGDGNDSMYGYAGNDTFLETPGSAVDSSGDDLIDGGTGTGDTVDYSQRTDGVTVLLGFSGYQTSGNGDDAENENDRIAYVENATGGSDSDSLQGNGYDNVLDPGPGGNDTLAAKGGIDTLSYALASSGKGHVIDLATGGTPAQTSYEETNGTPGDQEADPNDVISGFENVIGSPFPDNISGSDVSNRIQAGDNSDVVAGRGGDDTFIQVNDICSSDTFDGGSGIDTVDYTGVYCSTGGPGSDGGLYIDLTDASGIGSNGSSSTSKDGFVGVENVIGTMYDDEIRGDGQANRLVGLDGDDALYGDTGDDSLEGGAGTDLLMGYDGADTLQGGDDNDGVYGEDGNDIINGGEGSNTLNGGAGADTITGGTGADSIVGGSENDTIYAGAGNDSVDGGSGSRDFADCGAGTGDQYKNVERKKNCETVWP